MKYTKTIAQIPEEIRHYLGGALPVRQSLGIGTVSVGTGWYVDNVNIPLGKK